MTFRPFSEKIKVILLKLDEYFLPDLCNFKQKVIWTYEAK